MQLAEKLKGRPEMEKWDKWDYRIFGPLSLEDDATIEIVLINEDKTMQRIVLEVS